MQLRRVLLQVLGAAAVVAIALGIAVWVLWRTIPLENTAQHTFDTIIVLGTPCQKDGSPSPEQRQRVLEGVREWRAGVASRIIMTGAAAHNRWVEAASMDRLAVEQGVPPQDVFEERQALNTIQNVYYSVAIMHAQGWRSAEVVSSWYHLPRAALILSHFPILWRTDAAAWPPSYGIWDKAWRDWREAVYCLHLRMHGFKPSRFIARWK